MALSQLLVRLHQSIAKRGKKISQKKKEKRKENNRFSQKHKKKFLFMLNRKIVKLRLIPIQNQRLELKTFLV